MLFRSGYFFKLIILGISGVGKTCIIQRYCNNKFDGISHKTTLGFDFLFKIVEKDGKKIEMEIWDTAGQEQYRSISKMYYKEVHGVILVYDITSRHSFDELKYWLDDLGLYGNKLEEKIIVGNKVDMEIDREVGFFEARRFAAERNLELTECSAKDGQGVNEMFEILIDKIVKKFENNIEFRRILYHDKSVCVSEPISKEDEQIGRAHV